MNKLDLYDHLGCDIYSVEIVNGEKVIHVDGYYYDTGGNEGKPFRLIEACWCYVPLSKIVGVENAETIIDEEFGDCKQFIQDLTLSEAEYALNNHCNGSPPIPLDYTELTMSTPCGQYINA